LRSKSLEEKYTFAKYIGALGLRKKTTDKIDEHQPRASSTTIKSKDLKKSIKKPPPAPSHQRIPTKTTESAKTAKSARAAG
jgi:hypothetical protein